MPFRFNPCQPCCTPPDPLYTWKCIQFQGELAYLGNVIAGFATNPAGGPPNTAGTTTWSNNFVNYAVDGCYMKLKLTRTPDGLYSLELTLDGSSSVNWAWDGTAPTSLDPFEVTFGAPSSVSGPDCVTDHGGSWAVVKDAVKIGLNYFCDDPRPPQDPCPEIPDELVFQLGSPGSGSTGTGVRVSADTWRATINTGAFNPWVKVELIHVVTESNDFYRLRVYQESATPEAAEASTTYTDNDGSGILNGRASTRCPFYWFFQAGFSGTSWTVFDPSTYPDLPSKLYLTFVDLGCSRGHPVQGLIGKTVEMNFNPTSGIHYGKDNYYGAITGLTEQGVPSPGTYGLHLLVDFAAGVPCLNIASIQSPQFSYNIGRYGNVASFSLSPFMVVWESICGGNTTGYAILTETAP